LFKPFPWAPVDTVPANESPGPDVTFSKTLYFSGCLVVRCSEGHKYSGFCLKEERKVYKWGEANRIIQDLYNGKVKDLYSFQIIGSPYAFKLTSKEKEEHRILISILKRDQ
jgi:hypothetical protein